MKKKKEREREKGKGPMRPGWGREEGVRRSTSQEAVTAIQARGDGAPARTVVTGGVRDL